MQGRKDQRFGTAEAVGPVRTCVGCRGRDTDSRLLRIVHDPEAAALSPDPRRRAVGRGAWVHREPQCITTALDRKAFTRALRIAGNVSQDALTEVLEALRLGHEITRRPLGSAGGAQEKERTRHDEHTVKLQR
ncbi:MULTISPECIES: YlxR family protein [Dietzia]|uniref:YlxR family protein n=1 Tax=Dietzia TaxID=37914 RepID=UPI002096F8C4|nr:MULTISPECIES: YlxR family protein [Dietzia]MCT1433114.1 YlxR family protein [Dietzia maris]MCT1521593.1 YlxR family protein [Dietzia maris]USX47445.1 YlxR family protein [Dietzia kunjamensis]